MSSPDQDIPSIDSDALKANLLETAVDRVSLRPSFGVLLQVVRDFKGVSDTLEGLLYEVSHPFRNWKLLLPKLRSFVLNNLDRYRRHPAGPEAFALFRDIFLEAVHDSAKNQALLALAMEALLAYVERLVATLDRRDLARYQEALARCFTELYALDDALLLPMVQGPHSMKKIAAAIVAKHGEEGAADGHGVDCDLRPVGRLLQRVCRLTYQYWLSEEDPLPWFMDECGDMCAGWKTGGFFHAVSHPRLRQNLEKAEAVAVDKGPAEINKLLALPSHLDIVRLYQEIPERLLAEEKEAGEIAAGRFAQHRKLLFLYRIMDTAGLSLVHEETLREINRSLVRLIRRQSSGEVNRFLLTALQLLKVNVRKYPHTSLQCIEAIGSEVFKRGNSRLVEAFLRETARFGFQYANVVGINEEWQPVANPAHLANIRAWLRLIRQEPKWCSTLFSALIVNLKLSGTCIKDTDLFQRDMSQLLDHPIEPVYNLVKQFAKNMPVFFNEIGAEGRLRDVSTEIDEICNRRDRLVHFLRKQSHVESSNLIVGFIESIFLFWRERDKRVLRPYLPDEVLRQVKARGLYVDDQHALLQRAWTLPEINGPRDLLQWDDHHRRAFLAGQKDIREEERRRFDLLVEMYKLCYQKYNLGTQEMRCHLLHAAKAGFPEMEGLLADLESGDTFQGLKALLERLEGLKEIILSAERFEAKEDIYHKRHIAVDIPSVYGRYQERKFDALSLTFRLENLANSYLEKLAETVNPSFITKATFMRIIKCLRLYLRALKIDGITSRRLQTSLSLLVSSLGIKRFSYTQFLDIFRGLSEGVKDVIYTYYTNIHENNLTGIIPRIGRQNLLPRYRALWDADDMPATVNRLSETFMRDLIAATFGLQHLDSFITRICQTLENQRELLDEKGLDLLMTYNPERAISFLHQKPLHGNNIILLGNKGFNLTVLASEGKPVPPGFIVTTEIFRCWPVVREFDKARDGFMRQMRLALSKLEERTGRRYGDPDNPLLLSVRSGAAISMPGMMATIHNVGLNQEIVEGFARASGKKYLAWDNFRRFLQSWAMARGVEREVFQILMDEAKACHGVQVKRDFTADQMKELALEYRRNIRTIGISIPEDPWLQLTGAVETVLGSWDAEKTREYRDLMGVSGDWGTAVIVQAMVYGNLGPESGSGVLFTAHPYRKVSRVALWGDYAPGDQGEDIVSGLVTTHAVSVEQAELDGRDRENTLEVRFPRIYRRLLDISRELVYEKRWDPQEIEFTFEGPEAGDLHLLQTRDMITIKKKESFSVFKESRVLEKSILAYGIGASGGALSGRAVFTLANIEKLKKEDPETPLILIRQDTVPEDIKEIAMADGLLTARGGQTSHASVVATRLGKTCVVGCNVLKVYETEERCEVNGISIRFGDKLSIDGRKGALFKGMHPVKTEVYFLPL